MFTAMREYHWIFPHLLYDSFLVAAVSASYQMYTPIINISKLILAIQSWQQLLLSHETGIHWITIHMTIEAHTIGCGPDIKQLHTAALGDPWVETL